MLQKQFFQQGEYLQALGNIIQQTWEKAISKQGGAERPDDAGGFGPVVPPTPRDIIPGPDDTKKRGSLLPHIPFWFWIVLFLVIVPILCCCCCLCYCCCCRKGGGISSSPRRQGHSDIEGGGRGPRDDGGNRSGHGRGGGFNSFLGSLGGVGLGHLAGQLFGGGSKRRNVPPSPGYQGGGAYPAAPFQPDGGYRGGARGTGTGGKGLYPTAPVHDEGGGGGW